MGRYSVSASASGRGRDWDWVGVKELVLMLGFDSLSIFVSSQKPTIKQKSHNK